MHSKPPRCILEPLYADLLTFLFGSSEIWILETLPETISIIPTFWPNRPYPLDHLNTAHSSCNQFLYNVEFEKFYLELSWSSLHSEQSLQLHLTVQLSLFSPFSQLYLLLFNLESYKIDLVPILNISTLWTNVPLFHEPIYKTLPTYALRLLYNIELLSQVWFSFFWMSKRSERQPLT